MSSKLRCAVLQAEYASTIDQDKPIQARYFGTFHAYFAKKGLKAKLLYGFEFYFHIDLDCDLSKDGVELNGEMVSTMLEMNLVETDGSEVGSHFDGGVLLTDEEFEKRVANFKNKRQKQLRMGFPVTGVFNTHQRLITLQGHPPEENAANLKPCSYQIVLTEVPSPYSVHV